MRFVYIKALKIWSQSSNGISNVANRLLAGIVTQLWGTMQLVSPQHKLWGDASPCPLWIDGHGLGTPDDTTQFGTKDFALIVVQPERGRPLSMLARNVKEGN